jgi:pimeloyl-ACP methyl ester carboxylesterase
MDLVWDVVESGPKDAERTVLLLPGGGMSARSWAEVMAQPALAKTRLVAATLPGNAGAPPYEDMSFEALARATADLVSRTGVDVIVGFSNGASVAYEMVVSGVYKGPVVLVGVSLSAKAESAFFQVLVRLSLVLGTLPFVFLKAAVGSFLKKVPVSPERREELKVDFARNDTREMRRGLLQYLRWLRRNDDPARRLCDAGVPAWVVHSEKGGDGGLTPHERSVLEGCGHVRVVTLPGKVFFIPNEVPERISELLLEALAAV